MRILFAGGNGYIPEFSGGVQSSTDHLVRQSIESGHSAGVLAALFGDGLFGFQARLKMKLKSAPLISDSYPGYPVLRAWFPDRVVPHAVSAFRPDVAVVQCQKSVPLALALQQQGIPLVVYFRNVEFHELEGDPTQLENAQFIANSEFTANAYKTEFGLDCTVIPPLIDPEKYSTNTSGEFVTLINVYPEKGFDHAVEIAKRCPDIPFLFVEGWKLSDEHRAQVNARLAPLSNVTFEGRTEDMKTVYGRTKILLAPSKWEEAWGRVASEAHCSGIPVIGSRRGGLPEAIGKGGIVLDYDAPLDEWATTLSELWNEQAAYADLSAEALAFSRRDEMDSEMQFGKFISVVERAAACRQKIKQLA